MNLTSIRGLGMGFEVALHHVTRYEYDRPVAHSPHIVRLRPAPHSRTKIINYSMQVTPGDVFVNWQQDAFANYQARLVFPEKTTTFSIEVDLIADLEAINPFDFFLDDAAQEAGFSYDPQSAQDLAPYLQKPKLTPLFTAFTRDAPKNKGATIDTMVALNQYVHDSVDYIVRMEPGVQTLEQTLSAATGSCRDSGWLLVNLLRHLGYAARFVSGYLIQLTADIKPVRGPSGPEADFTDLHAWAEVYLPGAGWVGLDPTSGLFASEGHIPVAATPQPSSAAPIAGSVDRCEVDFDFEMSIKRLDDPPRQTKPLSAPQWAAIKDAGKLVDDHLARDDVRLTVGGEPTFVAQIDRDAPEWTTDAVGPTKRDYADRLIRRLRARFAPGGVLHHGQGKWYPGEQLPRWGFELHWRSDGVVLWEDEHLIAPEATGDADIAKAGEFIAHLADQLGVPKDGIIAGYEDPIEFSLREANLPPGANPDQVDMADPMRRRRLIEQLDRGIDQPKAMVLPLQQAQTEAASPLWMSELWQTRRGRLFLIPGDSAAGLRLPLESLPISPDGARAAAYLQDTMRAYNALPSRASRQIQFQKNASQRAASGNSQRTMPGGATGVRTALTVEPRAGQLYVFLPPLYNSEGYVALVSAIETVARQMSLPIRIEGYSPPPDPRLNVIKVTPDPGVIEVNIHPAHSFAEHAKITEIIYEEARQIGLDATTFMIDGRVIGSGGGNHVVMGGATPADSPFLRRPDLLASIIRYWQNHPSLSYLFSGLFVGPTSQAPRIDEARLDSLYQMEIALAQLPAPPNAPAWLVDRMFRNLLIDLTGNTHRAEICIDKLYSPDGPAGRLGLIEFRGFEMPPHPQMSVAQSLILRALISKFWRKPYDGALKRWGTQLHDQFMLPYFVAQDFAHVLKDLSEYFKITFDPAWFDAQREFRFPLAGEADIGGCHLSLRHAIEPWPTMGEQGSAGGTTRFVDSSCERLQLRLRNLPEGWFPTVNGVDIPLTQTDDGFVAGIRFRAWLPAHCLHPTIAPHVPLTFDLYDPTIGRSRGGFTYHVAHQGGRAHETRPVNALEAEGRRLARFELSHSPGSYTPRRLPPHPEYQTTLDLMRL